jgi:DNA-binding MarR family transcriptional regulator
MSDFDALMLLSRQDGTPPTMLAQQLRFSSGATTALVDRLEAAGYLARAPHPDDRRSSLLVLTNTGRAAVSGADAFYADATDRAIPRGELGWTTSRFRALARALEQAKP